MKTSIKLASLWLIVSILLGLAAFSGLASPDDDLNTYIPFVVKALNSIVGGVTDDGAPATGVALDLYLFDGASSSVVDTTATDGNGEFRFLNVAPLAPGQRYFVMYSNLSDPNRLYYWRTRELTSFTSGSTVNIGNFDIANVDMVSPVGTNVILPHTFEWTPRPASLTDSYQFDLFDFYDLDPGYFTVPEGYKDSYYLEELPNGFQYCNPYFWALTIHGTDGSFGRSYSAYGNSFHQNPLAGIHGCVTENALPVHNVTVELCRWTAQNFCDSLDNVTTENGYFSFTDMPSLSTGQEYYVWFHNSSDSDRLRSAWTNSLTSYTAGSTTFIGDFDIKNIPLELPGDNMPTSLPATFEWTIRPNTQWDDYKFNLYDAGNNLWYWSDPSLGYADSYSLVARPPGFLAGVWYPWDISASDLWGGGGVSYESRLVTFTSQGVTVTPVEMPSQARLVPQQMIAAQPGVSKLVQPRSLTGQNPARVSP